MIIQTGMRTDIPAYYSRWFINRIKEGYVLVRNPYNPNLITKYILNPSLVDLFAFCTKNPKPMFEYMNYLKSYGQYWFMTITPYDKDIEPNAPNIEESIESFKKLSSIVGINSIGWRYDPIFINDKYTINYHLSIFENMAKELCGYTQTCVISFIDIYKKVERNFPKISEVSHVDKMYLGKEIIKIASKYGMIVKPCAEDRELEKYGANCNGCLTIDAYKKVLNSDLIIPKKINQRNNQCACFLGNDIGAYNTCLHLCRYCYANTDKKEVLENYKKHNPNSSMLVGNVKKEDVIKEAKQVSYISNQIILDI